jgi:leucyl aminopeptidase (aminopeptidase T)
VDGSIDGVGLVNEPIRLQFKDGRLARIYGNKEAQKFRDYLKANWNSTSRDLVRIGVGTNHNAKLAGDLVEDETAFGRVHLGIGHSHQAAGAPLTPDYIRVTLRNSDLEIDCRPIVRRGKLMV